LFGSEGGKRQCGVIECTLQTRDTSHEGPVVYIFSFCLYILCASRELSSAYILLLFFSLSVPETRVTLRVQLVTDIYIWLMCFFLCLCSDCRVWESSQFYSLYLLHLASTEKSASLHLKKTEINSSNDFFSFFFSSSCKSLLLIQPTVLPISFVKMGINTRESPVVI
jgi:hypothetical protein